MQHALCVMLCGRILLYTTPVKTDTPQTYVLAWLRSYSALIQGECCNVTSLSQDEKRQALQPAVSHS
jgi:hypothetical protein